MFDGKRDVPAVEDAELIRLSALYDSLLADPPIPPDTLALTELSGMARIFDIDTDRPAAEVWLGLRAVLTRPTSRTRADGSRAA